MKKLITLFASLIILISVEAQQAKKFKDIVGRWEIAGEQNAGASLEIVDSTTMLLTYMGETKKISDIKTTPFKPINLFISITSRSLSGFGISRLRGDSCRVFT